MPAPPRHCTRLHDRQFLLSSQRTYTLAHLAEHTDAFSHDAATRDLAGDRITPHAFWAQLRCPPRALAPPPARVPQVLLGAAVPAGALPPKQTDYVATNDLTQDAASAVQEVYGWRWETEQLPREATQLTGIERCQARRARP